MSGFLKYVLDRIHKNRKSKKIFLKQFKRKQENILLQQIT